AAGLWRLAARRHVIEVAAHVSALRYRDVAAHEQGGDQLPPHLLVWVDLLLDQLPQHPRALRVADQHHASAPVEALHVVLPGGDDVGVGEARGRGRSRAGDAVQRELAIHRSEDAAALGEAGRLVVGDRDLLRVDGEIRVRTRVLAHRRIDVEAVDLRLLRDL